MTHPDAVDDLLSFIAASPTPYHAVVEVVRRLEDAGYVGLDEGAEFAVEPGDKVYVVRSSSSILAFEMGQEPPSKGGFRMVGAHTDSPNLRIKPKPHVDASGALQLAVEPYGGLLLHTWLDRDLSIAGRVTHQVDGELRSQLVRFDEPLCRIPSLAIHLDRGVNEDGLKLNKQEHMAPMFALENAGGASLLERLSAALGVAEDNILGWDLALHDTLPPARGGANRELIFAPRIDNLASCHAGLSALLAASPVGAATRGVVFYDHEEVGSTSAQGADSPFLKEVLGRLTAAMDSGHDAVGRALSRSFLISADMAHAVHPNYASKHEPRHLPQLGAGPVVKTNVNQRYATDGETGARFRSWCKAAEVTPQDFVTRSDLRCGSTIGPISAGRLGVKALDVGNPMLSMHSCREMAGAADVAPIIAVMRVFFERQD